jgi:solute carrier family 25 uncoupling protein 8/9
VKVRFQAQQRALGTETAPRYKSTVQAYRTIAKQEGARGLWKGEQHEEGKETCYANALLGVAFYIHFLK